MKCFVSNSCLAYRRAYLLSVVLGRPGSGCSTFLKVLANQREEFYAVDGDVYYDSLTPRQVSQHYRGDVQYCPEDDIHFPTLTVGQTLHFAAKTRAPQSRIKNLSRSQYTRKITDIHSTIFGLNHVKDTPVGDASIRGISGGEKKRVSCVISSSYVAFFYATSAELVRLWLREV